MIGINSIINSIVTSILVTFSKVGWLKDIRVFLN
jgi:hypothetical protein